MNIRDGGNQRLYFDQTTEDPHLELDMVFIDKDQINWAIKRHAYVYKKEVKIVESD